MAQRLHDFIVTESFAETPFTEPENGIPDDIFEAALIASEHDSNGEDPYEPQPKRFMQTEHQKRQQKRDLEIRRLAWTIRKIKNTHKANHQRRKKQKQRPSPFQKLPSDLVLKLMQHTNLRNIVDLINSSAINKSIFKANEKAVCRGIEIEQFREWKWLFGDSKYRTSAQSQHLKDAIISYNQSHRPGGYGWAYDEQLLEILQLIDNNEFTGVRNVAFLQDMQDLVDLDITAIEWYTSMNIARRTAICLRSLSFQRPGIVDEEKRTEYEPLVNALILPWEARSHLINEQPATIQTEIRSILKFVVEDLYYILQEVLRQWTIRYYNSPGDHREPQEVKKWMSKLVTGLILEAVVPSWRAKTGPLPFPFFAWRSASVFLARDLWELLNEHDEGIVEGLQAVKDGVDFGQSIGMNIEGLFDGPLEVNFWMVFGIYGMKKD